MSKPAYKFKEENIKCQLCSKFYNNPRLVPCLHSFCKDCLSKYIADFLLKGQGQNSGQGSKDAKSDGEISPINLKPPKRDGPARTQFNKAGKQAFATAAKQPPKQPPTAVSKTGPAKPKPAGNESPAPKLPTGAKGFPCPICRKFATTAALPRTPPEKWAEIFPENNLLAEIVELYSLKLGTRMCDPCKRNKASSRVATYCKICRDALCDQCTKTHNALRSCRSHKAIPVAQLTAAMENLNAGDEYCKVHDERVMDYFCFIHVTPCCKLCLKDTHKSCDKVNAVSEAVKKKKEIKELETLENALIKYNDHIQAVLRERSTTQKKLDSKKSKLMDEFLKVKQHIISQLEKMEKDLKVILDSTHRQESQKIKLDTTRCKEIQSGVQNARELLCVVDHHGGDSHHVEFTERVRTECEYYEESLGILCARIKAVDYEVTLDESLQQVIKRLNQFGRIDVRTSQPNLPETPRITGSHHGSHNVHGSAGDVLGQGHGSSSPKMKPIKPTFAITGRHANEIAEFCGQSNDDSNDCWFTGAVFLPDGRVILADRTNRKLKMFTSDYQPISEIPLSSKPWDVTVMSNKEVAYTLPAECRIQFITVGDTSMTVTRSIPTDEPCFGLHYVKGKIFTVTYDGDPPNLKVLTPKGEELTYVCMDDDGSPLFSKPVYVTCNVDGTQIYVSDERLGCIVSLKETGELNYAYSALELGHVAGMVLDKSGNIYACGNTSHNVHVLTPTGDHVRVLVTGEHITYPRAMAYEPREKKLLVTQGDQDMIKVYSVD